MVWVNKFWQMYISNEVIKIKINCDLSDLILSMVIDTDILSINIYYRSAFVGDTIYLLAVGDWFLVTLWYWEWLHLSRCVYNHFPRSTYWNHRKPCKWCSPRSYAYQTKLVPLYSILLKEKKTLFNKANKTKFF